MAELTEKQISYFMQNLPLIEARRAYPMAQLEAALKNIMGGKPDPADTNSKPLDPSRAYSADELLPWYAFFGEKVPTGLSVAAQKDLSENYLKLPAWALPLVDLSRL